MARRDPFPMSSDAAQRLVGDSKESTDWETMNMDEQKADVSADNDYDEAAEGLTGKATPKALNNEEEDDDDDNDGDVFIDRPLYESRGSPFQKFLRKLSRFAERIYKRLYGDQLPVAEMVRTLCLASTLFFMIGGYWLLRSLKDPVLTALCGVEVIPKAKIASVFVVLGVVSLYNRLLDTDLPRHRLFYIFGTFYFGLFIVIALLLMHPTLGLPNEQADPWRLLGWISYCGIESFGSVMVSLFWSFANSNISLESAKSCYGIMVATAQVGSIIGPTIVNRYAQTIGPASCYLIGAIAMMLLQGTMYIYIRVYGVETRNASAKGTAPTATKKKTNVLEGLELFRDHHYVKGIFAISCLFMVEVTIVDYTMKVLARDFFATEHPCEMGMSCWDSAGTHGMSKPATDAFTAFMGFFGQATNTLSLLLSLFGTSAIIRYLGLRLTLLLFPSLCLAVIIFVRMQPTLYVVFAAMMMLKANSYALNNPTKEILYQPTSSSVRYKAKSWIDIFGARGSKAVGSLVTNAFSDSASELVANGSLVGMTVASFLIWNATYMGRKFDEYTATGHVVGETDYEEAEIVELASGQNEKEDTSCAVYDDDDEVGPDEEGQGDSGDDDDDIDDGRKPVVAMV